ncbi:phosphate/phosphite/phosphonate ABC transporter substrate-binding protein [Celeribacter indicus]|uniref:ABC transporter, phosphonate, periplasmic substrate-binding protein phnD n=1 Tax=Celeribacter indicus TaxID=1208324 RepID=A0A0B5E020_9RHOB|nr:phosphate/phosphite/phosphonate ABC transporter substrate-binding protein [Celeribacter indicus]AJE45797.1 ABC transporter, phosphonate, periplasmic substrate-binding protein phnD [Celeribacter indicus]SDW60904.1 phosphonate transport system substrate-binding protein [Celeribacter indicus]
MRFITATALAALIAAPALAEGWKEDYQVIKFGILSGENEKDRLIRTEPLRDYLQARLGVEVEIFTAGNYDGVVQALAADQIEIAQFGSSAYAAAFTATDGGVEPVLTGIKEDGNTGYRSIVVTRCDSGITSLEDAKGKVHAFADPDSTSGYAVPYFNFITKEGFKPEEYFAAVPFSGSHEAGVSGVVNGTFDTAATYENNEHDGIYQRMESKGMIEPGVICKIWESPEITTGPWTVRTNLPAGLIADLTDAIEAFPSEDPEGYAQYSSFSEDDPNPEVGYTRVDRERYQWIVEMRDWIKDQRRGS